MNLAEFKAQASDFARELRRPVVPLEKLRDVLTFLDRTEKHSDDIDYADLCTSFGTALRRIVNPYRHRTVLERYRDPGDLRQAQMCLGLWIDALGALRCFARTVPEWHRTYDTALHRVVSALARQRKDQAGREAEGWVEAATICGAWLDKNDEHRGSDEYKMLAADYYFFEARAERARAQSLFDRRPDTPDALEEIAETFGRALAKIERSGRAAGHVEVVQLKFYVGLCKYRAAVMRRDFPACVACLNELERLAPITRMLRLPYFGRPEEIVIERHFVQAFKRLAESNIPAARCDAEPFRWPGRPSQDETTRAKLLGLRQLAIEILGGERDRVDELDAVWGGGVGLGQASRFIIDVCRGVSGGELSIDEARERLLSVFSLDASPPTSAYRKPVDRDIIDQLPKIYKTWLVDEDLVANEYGESRLLYLEWQYIANITEYLCGVYNLQRYRGEVLDAAVALPSDFRLLGFKELAELLRFLQTAIGWEKEDLEHLIRWVEDLSRERRGVGQETKQRAEGFLECIKKTAVFLFPHVVKVTDQQRLADESISVRVEREWSLPQRHLEVVCVTSKGLRTGDYYFLKAPFKSRFGQKVHEGLTATITFHPGSTFGIPRATSRCCLLVEGDHDAVAMGRLLDEYVPYWATQVDLRAGGGDSLPNEWERLRRDGYEVIVVADADKRGSWDRMSPFWLEPDFEGVDPVALGEAVRRLWGDSIGQIVPTRIAEVATSSEHGVGTIAKLRSYYRRNFATFSLPGENEMKRALRTSITDVWIKQRKVPAQIEAPVLRALEVGFGLKRW